MTEVWPYRTSWIVLYIEETEDVDPKTLLKTVYQQIIHLIPISTQQEPLLEFDNADSRQLEVFLSAREPQLTVRDVIRFLPCTVNLDPKLREWIVDWQATRKTIQDNLQATPGYGNGPDQSGLLQMASPGVTPLNIPNVQNHIMSPVSPIMTAPSTLMFDTPTSQLGVTPYSTFGSNLQQAFASQKQTQSSSNLISISKATSSQLSNWISKGGFDGLTEAGRKKASNFIRQENISGFVIAQLNGNYDCIRNGAKLNLGDGMILSSALAQNVNQPVIPTENENFSFKVPNQRPSVVQTTGPSSQTVRTAVEHARTVETGHSSVASPTEMRLDPMGMDNFEGFEQTAVFSPTQISPTQDIDSEEIFSQVQAKYNNALHDYWRLAAVDFEKSNDLFIND